MLLGLFLVQRRALLFSLGLCSRTSQLFGLCWRRGLIVLLLLVRSGSLYVGMKLTLISLVIISLCRSELVGLLMIPVCNQGYHCRPRALDVHSSLECPFWEKGPILKSMRQLLELANVLLIRLITCSTVTTLPSCSGQALRGRKMASSSECIWLPAIQNGASILIVLP